MVLLVILFGIYFLVLVGGFFGGLVDGEIRGYNEDYEFFDTLGKRIFFGYPLGVITFQTLTKPRFKKK